jgi:hypothetical protein
MPTELDASLCAGDRLRVGKHSRAAIMLSNETTVRLDQDTEVILAPPVQHPPLLDVISGVLYFFSRTPKSFDVKTPFINASVEGTELLIEAGKEASVQCRSGTGVPAARAQVHDVDRVTVYE